MSKRLLCLVPYFLALFWLLQFTQSAVSQSWTQAASYGGSGNDIGTAIRVSEHGDRYVTGSFSTVASFGGNTLTSAGGTDIFLARYARDGQLLWVVQAGGSGDDSGFDLALDKAGNTYVTGWFVGPASFGSVGGGSTTVTGSDDGFTESVFIAKYSITGNLLWVQTAIVAGIHSRSLTNNQGHGVAVDADANTVYVTGVAQADTDFSSFDGTTHTVRGPYTWHMFLVKYDLGGNFYWGETNEASPNTVPHSIAVDSQNGAYVTGWFEHLVTFYSHDGRDQTISGRSEPTQTYPDYPMDTFIAKYDSDGNLQWVNDIGGYIAVPAVPDGVAASRDGRIAVTGYIGNINGTTEQAETIVTSQPGGSNINLGGGNFTTPYNRDIFIAIYSSAGVLMSASRLGSEAQDSGSGIDFDNRGNLYVAGVFGSTLQVGNQVLTGTEPSNLFVLKYTKRGLAYAKSADGGAAQNVGLSPTLSVAKGGRVWVTGAFTDTATFDSTTLQSAGAEDIFVAELK